MSNHAFRRDRRMLGICPGDNVLVTERRGPQEIVHNALCTAVSMRENLLGTRGEPAIEVAFIVRGSEHTPGSMLQFFPDIVHLSHRDWTEGRAGLAYVEVKQSKRLYPEMIKASEVLGVLRQQHQAIDMLLAMRAQSDPTFFPSQSGPIWDAVVAGHTAICRMEAESRMMSPSFTCPTCAKVSYNPHDIELGYCGACHDFTGRGGGLDGKASYQRHR